jgi:predicted HTH domain antitoxin
LIQEKAIVKMTIDEALQRWQAGEISLGRSAVLAGVSKLNMMEEAGKRGLPIVDYDPADLDGELAMSNASGGPA